MLSLTRKAIRTISSHSPVVVKTATSTQRYTVLAESDDLFEALRQTRRELASGHRIPAYAVFNDATLHAMAAKSPARKATCFGYRAWGCEIPEIRQCLSADHSEMEPGKRAGGRSGRLILPSAEERFSLQFFPQRRIADKIRQIREVIPVPRFVKSIQHKLILSGQINMSVRHPAQFQPGFFASLSASVSCPVRIRSSAGVRVW